MPYFELQLAFGFILLLSEGRAYKAYKAYTAVDVLLLLASK
jgi:hypothetical protein